MKKLYILLFPFLFSACMDGSEDFGSIESGGNIVGQGGSLARFAVQGDFLYVLSDTRLRQFSIADPLNPEFRSESWAGEEMETIFPYGDSLLFMGSVFDMRIFRSSANADPEFISSYSHFTACDPVVVDFPYAYVTLRQDGCGGGNNVLDILDVSNIFNPVLVNTYQLSRPYGLGVDGSMLFVCEDTQGLRVYDRRDPVNPELIRVVDVPARDVIPYNGLLIVTATNGLHQYEYDTDSLSMDHLSTIAIQ